MVNALLIPFILSAIRMMESGFATAHGMAPAASVRPVKEQAPASGLGMDIFAGANASFLPSASGALQAVEPRALGSVLVLAALLAGLGYGAQYPLAISLLLRAAGGAVDKAQARATLAGGLAIGIAPFGLGALADVVGPHRAFLLVPVIAVLGAVASVAGARATREPR